MKEWSKEVIKIILVVVLIVLPIRYFLFQPFVVRGASMEPNFQEADYLIVDQISYRFSDPERGDVVVFSNSDISQKRYIKRIIGLPGEEIVLKEDEILVIDKEGEEELLPEGYLPSFEKIDKKRTSEESILLEEKEYFVMGDNRDASYDSRNWGSLAEENIIGKVFFRISFFDDVSIIRSPQY